MTPWTKYRKIASVIEMRPYDGVESLQGISVSPQDVPKVGDMIARNPDDLDDQWLVAKAFFEKHYERV